MVELAVRKILNTQNINYILLLDMSYQNVTIQRLFVPLICFHRNPTITSNTIFLNQIFIAYTLSHS